MFLIRYLPPKPVQLLACVKPGDRVCVRPRFDPAAPPAVGSGDRGLFPHLAYCPGADYYPNKDATPEMEAAPGVGTDIRLDMGSTVYLPYAGSLYIVGGAGPEQTYHVAVLDPPRTVSPLDKAPKYVWWTDRRADRDWSLTWNELVTAVAPVDLRVPNAAYAVEVFGAPGSLVTAFYGATPGTPQAIPAGGVLILHLNSATLVRFAIGCTYCRFLIDL